MLGDIDLGMPLPLTGIEPATSPFLSTRAPYLIQPIDHSSPIVGRTAIHATTLAVIAVPINAAMMSFTLLDLPGHSAKAGGTCPRYSFRYNWT